MAWATPFKVMLSVIAALTDGTSVAAALDGHQRIRTSNPDAVDQYQKYIFLQGSMSIPASTTTDTLISDTVAPASANYTDNSIGYVAGVSASKTTNNTAIAVLQSVVQDGANVLTANTYNLVAQAGTTAATTKLTWNGTVVDNLTVGSLVALHGGLAGLLTVVVPARPGSTLTDIVTLTVSAATCYLKQFKMTFDTPAAETVHVTIHIGSGATIKKLHFDKKLTANANNPNDNNYAFEWLRGHPVPAGTPVQVYVRTAAGVSLIINVEIDAFEEV